MEACPGDASKEFSAHQQKVLRDQINTSTSNII